MTADRYVILGLAPARSAWFDAVTQWAASASIAAEFIKCISAEEVRSRLASGRSHSALIVDASAQGFDRDLVDASNARSTPVIVVDPGHRGHGWARDLGCVAELPTGFSRDDLLDALDAHCSPVGRAAVLPPLIDDFAAPLWQAQMFAVCGPGGSGASLAAIALAQGLAADPRYGGRVLLADLALRADQAMLHDSPHLGPGLQELVEAHRLARPGPDEVSRMTFDVPRRGYRLLLGMRQPEAWAALRPRAVDSTISGIRRAFQAVVADVTGDLEGEAESGSAEVEERNHLARAATSNATLTIAVGSAGLKGVHSLARLVRELVASGVGDDRILAVVNRSPRHPRSRAESARALAGLLEGSGIRLALAGPLHLPERKVEEALRDIAPLPAAIVDPLSRTVQLLAERVSDSEPPTAGVEKVTPGSFGSWSDAEYGH